MCKVAMTIIAMIYYYFLRDCLSLVAPLKFILGLVLGLEVVHKWRHEIFDTPHQAFYFLVLDPSPLNLWCHLWTTNRQIFICWPDHTLCHLWRQLQPDVRSTTEQPQYGHQRLPNVKLFVQFRPYSWSSWKTNHKDPILNNFWWYYSVIQL